MCRILKMKCVRFFCGEERNSRSLRKVIFGRRTMMASEKKREREEGIGDLIGPSGRQFCFFLNKNIFSALSALEWDFMNFKLRRKKLKQRRRTKRKISARADRLIRREEGFVKFHLPRLFADLPPREQRIFSFCFVFSPLFF